MRFSSSLCFMTIWILGCRHGSARLIVADDVSQRTNRSWRFVRDDNARNDDETRPSAAYKTRYKFTFYSFFAPSSSSHSYSSLLPASSRSSLGGSAINIGTLDYNGIRARIFGNASCPDARPTSFCALNLNIMCRAVILLKYEK